MKTWHPTKQTQRAEALEEAQWTRRKLSDLIERVYVVEQLYYLSQTSEDAWEPFEKALRLLGEDSKAIGQEAKTWGYAGQSLRVLPEVSEALALAAR